MAVRGDHFTKTESVIWILIAGALCFVELRALNEDHAAQEARIATAREQDDINRRLERRQFSALLASGNKLLSTEKDLSQTTMNALTGGESFCYVEMRQLGNTQSIIAILLQRGSNPVQNVEVQVMDIDLLKPPVDMASLARAQRNFSIPFLRVGTYFTQLFQFTPDASTQSKKYNVTMVARNGRFTERIRLRLVKGTWLSAKRVDASYYSKRFGLVLEEIDTSVDI